MEIIENEDGSTQMEFPVESIVRFDEENMDVEKIFNFDEMRKSLSYSKTGFTVHPYPKDDFTPISIHATLEMWNIEVAYHCKGYEDADCLIDIYSRALSKIDSVIKERLGRKWGLYLMPDGYNLAIVHNYEEMARQVNKLILIEKKKDDKIQERLRISKKVMSKLKKKKGKR